MYSHPNYFNTEFDKLIAVYGDRNLGLEVREIFWQLCQKIPESKLHEVFNDVISAHKWPPKPVEFKEAVRAWKRRNQTATAFQDHQDKPPKPIKCKDCHDTGFIFVNVTDNNESVLCCCTCSYGVNCYILQLNKSEFIPLYKHNVPIEVIKKEFPIHGFVPKSLPQEQPLTFQEPDIIEIVQRFTTKKKESAIYWEKYLDQIKNLTKPLL